MPIAEALRHGVLDGSSGKAQMLSGVIQSPAFDAAYGLGYGATDVLAHHARLVDHPSFRALAGEARRVLGLDLEERKP